MCLVTVLDVHGFAEIEENNSNDTLACYDNSHKAVLCTSSLIQWAWLLSLTKLVLLWLNKAISMILSLIITNLKIKMFFAGFLTW